MPSSIAFVVVETCHDQHRHPFSSSPPPSPNAFYKLILHFQWFHSVAPSSTKIQVDQCMSQMASELLLATPLAPRVPPLPNPANRISWELPVSVHNVAIVPITAQATQDLGVPDQRMSPRGVLESVVLPGCVGSLLVNPNLFCKGHPCLLA